MGYYMAGDYYMAGGLFSGIGKALGGIAKTVVGGATGFLTGGPLGAVGGALKASGILGGAAPQVNTGAIQFPGGPIPILGSSQLGPPGVGVTAPGYKVNKQGMVVKARRRMNPANPKALRRAMRREEAFVRMARRSLKGSKYTISTRGSRRSRRDVIVPRHTQVR